MLYLAWKKLEINNNINKNSMLWIKCFMSLQNSYVEALTPSMAIYGDGASKEGLKVKQGQGGALILSL